jgi:hypothetical protein
MRSTDKKNPVELNQRMQVVNRFIVGLETYIKGDYHTAYQQFMAAASVNRDQVETSAYIYAANAASRDKKYDLALKAIDIVLAENGQHPRALYARGNALLNMAANEIEYYDLMLDLTSEETCLSPFLQPLDQRRVAQLAILCFEEAQANSATSEQAVVSLKAQVSLGQANAFLAALAGGEYERWEVAREHFSEAIQQFALLEKPSGLSYFAGLAYRGLADVDVYTEGSCQQQSLSNYQEASKLFGISGDRISAYVKDNVIKPLAEKIKSCT